MQKTDAEGHNNGEFQDRDLPNNVDGTKVSAKWLNMIQNELINLAKMNGMGEDELSWDDSEQVKKAVYDFITNKRLGEIIEFAAEAHPRIEEYERVIPCIGQTVTKEEYPKLWNAFNGQTDFIDSLTRERLAIIGDEIKIPNTREDVSAALIDDGIKIPVGITVVGDSIYLCDSHKNKVSIWEGGQVFDILITNRNLTGEIAVDGDNIYFVERDSGGWQSITKWSGGIFPSPTSYPRHVYITENRGVTSSANYIFNARYDREVLYYNTNTPGIVGFDNVTHITTDNGTLYAIDRGDKTVKKYEGGVLSTMVSTGTDVPNGIAAKDGVVYYTDSQSKTIRKVVGGVKHTVPIAEDIDPYSIAVYKDAIIFINNASGGTELRIWKETEKKLKYLYHGEDK